MGKGWNVSRHVEFRKLFEWSHWICGAHTPIDVQRGLGSRDRRGCDHCSFLHRFLFSGWPFSFTWVLWTIFVHSMFNAGWGHAIDVAVITALCAIGFSLMLGIFTQLGCYGAMAMLALFYLTAMPLDGVPHPGMEGNYMIVNKNLIEWVAVAVVWSFQSGIA